MPNLQISNLQSPMLSPTQCQQLAETLPDTPEAVIAISQLRRGLARAWLVGDVGEGETAVWETAVIEDTGQPGEPLVFGHDVAQMVGLLAHIPDWFCVNVSRDCAPALAPLIEEMMGCPVRLLEDVYHTLTQPAPIIIHPDVRLLTPADLALLESAPFELQGVQPRRTLLEMAVAGAVVDGRLVAIAQNYARTDSYGEIGVHTLPAYRQKGYATAAAAAVARYIQSLGLTPVWSCGAHNEASLRTAVKLGFHEVSRRMYIILDG
ncbi:MAG TPA: GNAT family N-acetyltransferase [Chloroflexota bacterium]|nr:GNAT family N-acetyltransferase [Chloroflexota bacterium]